MVRLQSVVVIDDVVVGGTNSPPVSSLAGQVEVIPAEKQEGVERRSHSQTGTVLNGCVGKPVFLGDCSERGTHTRPELDLPAFA